MGDITAHVINPSIYGVVGNFVINTERGPKGDPGGMTDASVLGSGHFWSNGLLNNDNFLRESSLGTGFAYDVDGKVYVDVSTIAGGVTFQYVDASLNAKTNFTYSIKQDTSILLKTNFTYDVKQDASISLKSDKTYVDASLNAKTNFTYSLKQDASISLKADFTYDGKQDASILLKSDKTYVDASLNAKTDFTYDLKQDASILLKTDFTYDLKQDASILLKTNFTYDVKQDASINLKADLTYVDSSISVFATNASVNDAFITNTSLGKVGVYDLTPYATNASVNDAFITNASLGKVGIYDLTPYATNASIGLALFLQNASLNQSKFKYVAGLLEPSTSSSAVTSLTTLTDVSIVSPLSNQVLGYDASLWKNLTINASLYEVINASEYFWIFSDVSLTSPANNQVLSYDEATAKFVNKTVNASMYEVDDGSTYFQTKIGYLTKASNALGSRGEWSFDASYLYVCTSTNIWMRILGISGY